MKSNLDYMETIFSHKNILHRLRATKELRQYPHWDFIWGPDYTLNNYICVEFTNFNTTILHIYDEILRRSGMKDDDALFRAILMAFIHSGKTFFSESTKVSWNSKHKKLSLSRPTLEEILESDL